MIATVAERLLNRRLRRKDGYREKEVAAAETRLGFPLPTALRQLYLLIGRVNVLVDSFQHFFSLDQLTVIGDKLCFLQENQTVCYWSCDLGEENPLIYQTEWQEGEGQSRTPKDTHIQEANEIRMTEFLDIILYYQMAQIGYQYAGDCDSFDTQKTLSPDWNKVVDHNGLVIWWRDDCLIWYLTDPDGSVVDDDLFLSTRTRKAFNQAAREYGFYEF
ncbi:MAG: SMI1/KNR4 family protein [Erysipelotrichaceae bacterium]|jgi:hypothetical protein|nr:SMI1/KNR4 family protein [Erysipelotrichaceae bacterium]